MRCDCVGVVLTFASRFPPIGGDKVNQKLSVLKLSCFSEENTLNLVTCQNAKHVVCFICLDTSQMSVAGMKRVDCYPRQVDSFPLTFIGDCQCDVTMTF